MDKGDIGPFEGLIHSTAARYAPYLDDLELDDIKQLLRIKVWQALMVYDRKRMTITGEAEDVRRRFVFSCVSNRVKDMLKAQSRLNRSRNGCQLYVEDQLAAAPGRFEHEHFRVDGEVIFAVVEEEEFRLPSTLTVFEVRVVHLLLLDFSQTEAARILDVPRGRVRSAHGAIKEKMADWKPSPAPLPVAA